VSDWSTILNQARRLIEAGNLTEAKSYLTSQDKQIRDSADYWWLIAQTFDKESDEYKKSISSAYKRDPSKYSEISKELTANLAKTNIEINSKRKKGNQQSSRKNMSASQSGKKSSTGDKYAQPAALPSKNIRPTGKQVNPENLYNIIVAILLLCLVGAIVFLIFNLLQQVVPPVSHTPSVLVMNETDLPSAITHEVTENPLQETNTPFPINTEIVSPSPSSLTIIPTLEFTFVVEPTLESQIATQLPLISTSEVITNTNLQPTPTFPVDTTLNDVVLGEEGNFNRFPIRLFFITQQNEWNNVRDVAIRELNTVIPIELTSSLQDSDVVIEIIKRDLLYSVTTCGAQIDIAGCTNVIGVRDIATSGSSLVYSAHIWIAEDAYNPIGAVLHELLHSLGLRTHSRDANDIMYGFETNLTRLSPNDIAQLQSLYPASQSSR